MNKKSEGTCYLQVFYIIGNFFEITYDIKTLSEHAHAFAKEECHKNATQKQFIAFVCIIHDCEEQSSEQLCIIICKDIL